MVRLKFYCIVLNATSFLDSEKSRNDGEHCY